MGCISYTANTCHPPSSDKGGQSSQT